MQVLILLFKLNYFSWAVEKIIIKNFIAHNAEHCDVCDSGCL